MTKLCAYCGRQIRGEATPLADDAGSGAHAVAYWHTDRAECGPRLPPLPGPGVTVPPRFVPLGRDGRP